MCLVEVIYIYVFKLHIQQNSISVLLTNIKFKSLAYGSDFIFIRHGDSFRLPLRPLSMIRIPIAAPASRFRYLYSKDEM